MLKAFCSAGVICVIFLLPIHLLVAQNPVCDFEYKKTLTIQGSQITGGPHSNFPVLISHTDPDLSTASSKVTSASGYDIIFADDTGSLLDFQLEKYDGATGEYVGWVKIPTITNGTDVDIHMLYGKSSITTDQSTTATWDSNFTGVYHLNNNDLTNAESPGTNDGTNNLTTNNTASKIAGGRSSVPGTGHVRVGTTGMSNSSGTVELWGLGNSWTTTPQYFYGHTTIPAFGNRIQIYVDDAGGNLDIGLGSSHFLATGIATLTTGTWYHIALTWNSGNYAAYVNGALAASGNYSNLTTLNTTADLMNNGNTSSTIESLNGDQDEARISNTARSANWIATSYNSQNQPILTFGSASAGDFYAVATEDDLLHTSDSNGDWDDNTRWDSDEVPDGQFVNVEIQHDIDVDANSADYTVCNCLLNGTGASSTFLDISSTRTLTVKGDLDATYTGTGNSGLRLQVENTANTIIEGDMTWDRTNDGNGDMDINLRDDAVIDLSGNLEFDVDDGDDNDIDLEDDSDFNITGNLTYIQDGGDLQRILIDDNATMDLTGDLIIDQNGGNDIHVRLNDGAGTSAQLNIAGDVNVTHDGGDDIEFRTNGSSSLLDITGDLIAVCNGTNDGEDFRLDANDGTININNVSLTRTADMGEMDFDLDGGDITINSLIANSSGTLGNSGTVTIDIDQASIFTCNNDIDVTMTGGDDFRIGLNRNGGTAAQFDCGGNLTVNRSDGDDIEFFVHGSSSLLHIAMDLSVTSSGGETFNIDINDNATMDIDGDFTLLHTDGDGGEFDLQAGFNPTLNVDGSVSVTINGGGNDDYTFDINAGTFQIDTDFDINLNGSTSEDIDIQVDNDAIVNVGGNMSATITGGDDIDIDLGDNSGGSTAQFNITGNATYIQNTATAGHSLEIRVFDNTRYTVGGDLTLTNSVANSDLTLMNLANTGRATITGDINLNAQSSGDLEVRLDDTSELQIGGDFVRQASPSMFGELDAAIGTTVEYNGTASQLFAQDAGDGGDGFSYGIVEINNTSGTNPQVTMEGLATVNGGIVFIDGVVASTSTNILVVPDGATATGASDASHVDGPVRKIGDDAFTFPVGDNDNYQAIAMSAPSAITDVFEAQYFETDPDPMFDRSMKDASINNLSTVEYWELNQTSGSSSVSVTLTWGGNSGVLDLPSLLVAGWDGALWKDLGNGGTTGTTAAGAVVSSGTVSTFGPFTLGSTSTLNPLPIVLLSFTAAINGEQIDLFWTTASEVNNDFFTIERTRDLSEWEIVTKLPGAGNSSQTLSYQSIDPDPYLGVSYYRLKQTDFDGQFSYSEIVKVVFDVSTTLTFFPNPPKDRLTITSQNALSPDQVQLVDGIGKYVPIAIASISERKLVLSTRDMSPGVYYLVIQTEVGPIIKKILIASE